MPFTPGAYPGSLHHYAPRLVAFEHNHSQHGHPHNFVLFLGGLGDSFMTVRYPSVLARTLPLSWALAEVQTTSSGAGFTTGSLKRDAQDLSEAITYFRGLAAQRNADSPAKIILLGHSTGCQDAIHYLVGPWKAASISTEVIERPRLDGVVLQAGISDREGIGGVLSPQEAQRSLDVAEAMIKDGRGHDHMPISATKGFPGAQPIARRWVSLLDKQGDDDYFSSDLSDERLERVWGRRGLATRRIHTLVLIGGADEHMPQDIDKAKLVAKWEAQVKNAGGLWDDRSGVVEGASHNLNRSDDNVVEDFCRNVLAFVQSIDSHTTHQDTGKL